MYGHGFHPSLVLYDLALHIGFVHLTVVFECHLWASVRRLDITDDFCSNRHTYFSLRKSCSLVKRRRPLVVCIVNITTVVLNSAQNSSIAKGSAIVIRVLRDDEADDHDIGSKRGPGIQRAYVRLCVQASNEDLERR